MTFYSLAVWWSGVPHRLKSRGLLGRPLRGSRAEWFPAFSSFWRCHVPGSAPSSMFTHVSLASSSTSEDPWDDTGPTQITQGNPISGQLVGKFVTRPRAPRGRTPGTPPSVLSVPSAAHRALAPLGTTNPSPNQALQSCPHAQNLHPGQQCRLVRSTPQHTFQPHTSRIDGGILLGMLRVEL